MFSRKKKQRSNSDRTGSESDDPPPGNNIPVNKGPSSPNPAHSLQAENGCTSPAKSTAGVKFNLGEGDVGRVASTQGPFRPCLRTSAATRPSRRRISLCKMESFDAGISASCPMNLLQKRRRSSLLAAMESLDVSSDRESNGKY